MSVRKKHRTGRTREQRERGIDAAQCGEQACMEMTVIEFIAYCAELQTRYGLEWQS